MDLQHLRASDGTGEAVLAHIQTNRTIGSTVLDLDNVDNWNSKCVVVTGTPAANGFISPTGMKVMYGHLSAGDFIIDGYAPGYVDNGNTTAEVAIVKMTTSWADALVDILSVAHQDNGKLKTSALDEFYKPSEITPNSFVASGGIIAISAGLTGTFSNIVYYIGGLRYTKTGVANKVYTASKDTYVDIGTDGVVDYTEVANDTAAPALAASHIRLAKVVTSGAAITSIVQNPFSDGIGNAIRNTGSSSTGSLLIPVKFLVTRASTAVTIANTPTVLIYDGKVFDTSNSYSTVSGVFTAPVAGYYDFNAAIVLTAAVSRLFLSFYKNGNEYSRGADFQSATGSVQNSTFMQLDAGDTVTARYYVNNNVNISNSILTQFSGKLVSVA